MTVVDLRAPAGPDVTTQVAFDLDHARFWALVVDALERIGDPSDRLSASSTAVGSLSRIAAARSSGR